MIFGWSLLVRLETAQSSIYFLQGPSNIQFETRSVLKMIQHHIATDQKKNSSWVSAFIWSKLVYKPPFCILIFTSFCLCFIKAKFPFMVWMEMENLKKDCKKVFYCVEEIEAAFLFDPMSNMFTETWKWFHLTWNRHKGLELFKLCLF